MPIRQGSCCLGFEHHLMTAYVMSLIQQTKGSSSRSAAALKRDFEFPFDIQAENHSHCKQQYMITVKKQRRTCHQHIISLIYTVKHGPSFSTTWKRRWSWDFWASMGCTIDEQRAASGKNAKTSYTHRVLVYSIRDTIWSHCMYKLYKGMNRRFSLKIAFVTSAAHCTETCWHAQKSEGGLQTT